MFETFYRRLQWLALLPLAAFVWSGLADTSLGWAGTLPTSLDFDAEPGRAAVMIIATLIEAVVPVGLLVVRTRAASALALSGYVLIVGLSAYWNSASLGDVPVHSVMRIIAVSGALLFVFAATQALRHGHRPPGRPGQ